MKYHLYDNIKRYFAVLGPTASGKSCSLENLYNSASCMIINCDSKQVYGDVEIITDQPSEKIQNKFLYGTVSLDVNYSVKDWLEEVQNLIYNIPPLLEMNIIFIGGSTIYSDCLINGISDIPQPSSNLIQHIKNKCNIIGNNNLWNEISNKFPGSLDHIHPNNTYKLIKESALIIHTGKNTPYWYKKNHRKKIAIPSIETLCLIPNDRNTLYTKINQRVLTMMERGAIEEVESALNKYNISDTAKHIHGLKEINAYIKGEMNYKLMIETIQLNTRRYAKRQITWLKNKTRVNKVFTEVRQLSKYLTSRCEL